MSDLLQIRSGFFFQETASVYSTPLSINNTMPVVNNPSFQFFFMSTTAPTVPANGLATAAYRFNFTPSNYSFAFYLAGGGNIMVVPDDAGIAGFTGGLCLYSNADTAPLAFNFTPVQVPIQACRSAGAMSAGLPARVSFFTCDGTGANSPIVATAPNVSFNVTVFCY